MMTKTVFWLCILSVSTFAEGPRFAFDDGGTITPTPAPTAEKPPEVKFAIDHGKDLPSPKVEEGKSSRPQAAVVDPNAPSDAEEPLVPNPFKILLSREDRAHIRQVNYERSKIKVNPPLVMLAPAPTLMAGAKSHSQHMRDANFFAHKPGNKLPGNGIRGENIAAGSASMLHTMSQQWMKSQGHKDNILGRNWKYIGVGHASGGGRYGEYWTQNFSSEP